MKHLVLVFLSALQLLISLPAHSKTVDGFVANCTSNQDGTGQCVNQETMQGFTCLIIPGQVIDCNTASGREFQCVSISGAIGNQAQFSCDPKVDRMLIDELNNKAFKPEPISIPVDETQATTDNIIDGTLTDQQLNLLDYLNRASAESQYYADPKN